MAWEAGTRSGMICCFSRAATMAVRGSEGAISSALEERDAV